MLRKITFSIFLFSMVWVPFFGEGSQKKILFLMTRMDVGGTERAFISLINNMPFPNTTIDVYLRDRGGPFEAFLQKNIRIITLQEAQKKNYDVAISFAQFISPEKWVGTIHAKKKIQWLHFDPMGNNNRYNVNQSWKKIDAFITVSEATKARFIEAFPEFSGKVHAIYNIIDNQGIRKEASQPIHDMKFGDREVSIVTLARLNKLKALDRAIRIHSKLEREGIHFRWYVLGDGVEEKNLKNLISKNNLKSRFFLLGNKLNPYPYLAHADIVALLSLEESYGLAIIEAKILGSPLLMTNTAAAKELITQNVNGIIVEQSDASIYAGLKRLILDKQLREKFHESNKTYTFDNSPSYSSLEALFF